MTTAFKDDRTNAFNVDLCEALVAANIPWTKIGNPVLKQFLQKYCNRNVPSESTLRKNYLRPLYEQTLARIREELGDSCIWISVDETTDVKGRFVAHFLAGKLAAHEKTRAFLVCSKPLERTNGESVAFFVNESLKVLYPSGVEATKVLLLYTDAAAYMHKAAHLLKAFYPQMLHVTCLAHALHRVCEELRKHFTDVNELIGSAKAVFLKAPSRVRVFKEMLPDVPLPPEPVVTRWGTWLKAVEYYNCYFSDIKAVINGLPIDESVAVTKAQAVLSVNSLPGDLAYLCANFTFLADSIKKLESAGETLVTNVALILHAQERIATVPEGPVAEKARAKLQSVLDKNKGFSVLKEASEVLAGEHCRIPVSINPSNLPKYKYAPIASVDVERSFSAYKLILSDKRHNFEPGNLEKLVVTYCFYNFHSDS